MVSVGRFQWALVGGTRLRRPSRDRHATFFSAAVRRRQVSRWRASDSRTWEGTEGKPRGREEAFQSILRIADFFDQKEPQSLVGQSLREIVRRGRMPMISLLEELLPDADQRATFLQRAGIKIDSGGETY